MHGYLADAADRGCWLALLPAPLGPLLQLTSPGAHHHRSDQGDGQKAGVKQTLQPQETHVALSTSDPIFTTV